MTGVTDVTTVTAVTVTSSLIMYFFIKFNFQVKMFAKRLREKFAFFLSHLQPRLTKDAQGETFFI